MPNFGPSVPLGIHHDSIPMHLSFHGFQTARGLGGQFASDHTGHIRGDILAAARATVWRDGPIRTR